LNAINAGCDFIFHQANEAGLEREETRGDGGDVDAADQTGLAALRLARGDDAEEVGGLLDLEAHRCDVRRDRAPGGGDEDRLGILRAGVPGGVLVLEAVAEGEIDLALAEGAEALVHLRGSLRLLMRDLGAELVLDPLHALPGQRVPAAVGDRAGGEQADLERLGGRGRVGGGGGSGRLALLAGERKQREKKKHSSFHGRRFYGWTVGGSQWYTAVDGCNRRRRKLSWTRTTNRTAPSTRTTTSRSSR
jgi:hypothetical protein